MKKRQRSASTLLQDTLLIYLLVLMICIAVAVVSISRYLRALFRNGMEPIPLKEELDVIDNYLAIQHIRYGGKYAYRISRQEGLEEIPIPPFILLTMVENSIKHNLTPDGVLNISLDIQRVQTQDEACLYIVIDDSGGGFPPGVLQRLNQGKKPQRQSGHGIGIWNTLQRLRIIYGGQASILFSNNACGGARVEIRIPLRPPDTAQEKPPTRRGTRTKSSPPPPVSCGNTPTIFTGRFAVSEPVRRSWGRWEKK